MHQALKKKKVKKVTAEKKLKKKKKLLFVVSVLSNQNIVFFCPLPLIYCFCNIFPSLVLV